MVMSAGSIVGLVIRLFVLLSPFCTLSLFLACSGELDERAQRGFAARVALAVWGACVAFYLFGQAIFGFLGITLNAFRVPITRSPAAITPVIFPATPTSAASLAPQHLPPLKTATIPAI